MLKGIVMHFRANFQLLPTTFVLTWLAWPYFVQWAQNTTCSIRMNSLHGEKNNFLTCISLHLSLLFEAVQCDLYDMYVVGFPQISLLLQAII